MNSNAGRAIAVVLLTTLFGVRVGETLVFQMELPTASGPAPTVHLLVRINATLDDADVDQARATTDVLLASVGIRTEWHDCRDVRACDLDALESRPLIVQLFSSRKLRGGDICGEVIRDPIMAPTIAIYVAQIVELRSVFRLRGVDRGDLLMSTLTNGHLVGMTIAHEVGHVLGIRHSSVGVMQARLSSNDVVALRRARLTFTPQQGVAMRHALGTKKRGQAD